MTVTNTAITPAEVASFMGLQSDITTTQTTMLTALILQKTREFRNITGRSAEAVETSLKLFQDGIDCSIEGPAMWLDNFYRDIISISVVKESNSTLTVVSDSNDGNDYIVDPTLGQIIRNQTNWSQLPMDIKITGIFGLSTLVSATTYKIRDDVKLIIIEMVGAASGLWKTTVITDEGNIETVRNSVSAETKKRLQAYKIKGV